MLTYSHTLNKMKNIPDLLPSMVVPLSAHSLIGLEGYNHSLINPSLYEVMWSAYWISVPEEPANVYGVYHFRKTFDMQLVLSQFIVHVSADNRYKLYVNGNLVSLGSARGDILNWNFETVDIAPYLQLGNNVIAAVVWNYAERKPTAQMSLNQMGFLLQGNSEMEEIVNTNRSWKCIRNAAYSPWEEGVVVGYYAAGPGELVNANIYPWGWEKPEYDDSSWSAANEGLNGAIKGFRDYPGRLLVPSPIPPVEMKVERLSRVRISEGVNVSSDFPETPDDIVIPANSSARLILDNEQLTIGYLTLLFSSGLDAEITISYAEALYYMDGINKGNRDDIEGKQFLGYQDRIIADGGENRSFTTLWWRTWRYIEVNIKTASEPLVLLDVYGTFAAYPFTKTSRFETAEYPHLSKMLDIGWLTARLCAYETYMDCPYYEQLQYFGDTRIQTMITFYNTDDAYLAKNAIEQGKQSVVADGITMSRYPTAMHQFISSYSLSWIGMGYDYWMHRGDNEYVRSLLPVFRRILSWYEQWLKPDFSMDYIPYWFFADWADGFLYGEPIREDEGNSAFQDLVYLMALDEAVKMEQAIGMLEMADYYRSIADGIRNAFQGKYWNNERALFADTHDHRSYSQHVNTLAILAEIVTGQEAADLMDRVLSDETLIQATIYFRYYVHQALNKAGLGDRLPDILDPWHDQMALGLTTWAETPEPSRSDCHAWGASLNIEFFRILLGVESDAPGFEKVLIKPSLGELKSASGVVPHPKGEISVSYSLDTEGSLNAVINLPQEVTGTFFWGDKAYLLSPGEQTINPSNF